VAVDATTTSNGLFSLSTGELKCRVSQGGIAQPSSAQQALSDEVLLGLVHQNDREALSQLFHRYAAHVYGIGRRILRDASEAEDLVQEVFLYIHTKSAIFNCSRGTARSWIFQVAYTQAFLRRRILKHHGLYSHCLPDKGRRAESVAQSGAGYDQTIEHIFGSGEWRRILKSLTEEQRETLRLHFFEGFTFAEIAEKLGQSYANVRNHHYRGLEKVRKHLAQNPLNGK
jgi:RNA polymerase sigma-70 factor (ECF subfamily)